MSRVKRLTVIGFASFCVVGNAMPCTQAPSEALRQVAQLHVARAAHTATTLPSGHVLVAGGMATGGGGLASAELFDPASNRIQELGSLGERRAAHTATLLPDGRILFAGGYNGEYLRSIEVFDPSSKQFRSGGPLAVGRSGHTATLLPDGRILFVGGVGRGWTFLRSAELYDPATGRSQEVGPMRVPRESHTATLLEDGRVLVIGGHAGRRQNMEVYATTEIFSVPTGRFAPGGALLTARHKHDAVKLADGRVLVVGGADRTDRLHYSTTEVYRPETGGFEAGPSMNHRRYKIAGTAVVLNSGAVLIPSGAPAAELLDVGRLVFREVAGRFPAAYRFAAVAPLPSGGVVIVGGYSDDNNTTPGIWRFDGN